MDSSTHSSLGIFPMEFFSYKNYHPSKRPASVQNFDFIVNFVINKVVKFIINVSNIYSSDLFQSIYFLDHLNECFFFFLQPLSCLLIFQNHRSRGGEQGYSWSGKCMPCQIQQTSYLPLPYPNLTLTFSLWSKLWVIGEGQVGSFIESARTVSWPD